MAGKLGLPERKALKVEVSIKCSIQYLWEATELNNYRLHLQTDPEYMERHNKRVEQGKPIWVDCHERKISMLPDGSLKRKGFIYRCAPDKQQSDEWYILYLCDDPKCPEPDRQIRLFQAYLDKLNGKQERLRQAKAIAS